MITVHKFTVNPLQENSYLLHDETGQCLIVDAGFHSPGEKEQIATFISNHELIPVALVNTHCHFDHILGVPFLKKRYEIPFYCHREDAFWLPLATLQGSYFGVYLTEMSPADRFLEEHEEIRFGNSLLKVIHVPGHSPGHLVFYSPEDKLVMAGDVLFKGGIGRTDLEGGNYSSLIGNIHGKLMVLPGETVVYSGHGPETTIGAEKSGNLFLQRISGE